MSVRSTGKIIKRTSIEVVDRARNIPRSKAIEKVERDTDVQERMRFVIKFDPRLPNRTTLKRAWTALVEDREMKKVFPAPPMVCYKRVQNLGEMLVRAKLPTGRVARRCTRDQEGFTPCRQSNCSVCGLLRDKSKIVKEVSC